MKPCVAYLVSRFPKTSETFIVDEVMALEEAGVDVRLHALADGRGAVVGPDASRLDARCIRLPLFSPRLALAQLRWLARAPLALLGIWFQVVARHATSPRALARAVVAVAHAAAHAETIPQSGARHVHAHWATHTALAAWVIHRLTGLSYSFTAHADDLFVMRPMIEEKVRGAAFVVTISEYNRSFLAEHVAAASQTPIEVVRCGISTEAFRPGATPADDGPFDIACVARLEPKKGHTHLLDACAALVSRGVSVRCRLIGEGRQRDALEEQIRSQGLSECVELLGAQPREAVRAAIAEAHVFALPSVTDADGRADGIPVALMEAMAMQRPVVTTRVSGIPELVEHEVSGLLVRPGDAVALADAIDRIRSEPVLAEQLASAGRTRVLEVHDLHRNVGRLRDLFVHQISRPPATERSAALVPGEPHGELR